MYVEKNFASQIKTKIQKISRNLIILQAKNKKVLSLTLFLNLGS